MLVDQLKKRFGADLLAAERARGEETIAIAHAAEVMGSLRDEQACAAGC